MCFVKRSTTSGRLSGESTFKLRSAMKNFLNKMKSYSSKEDLFNSQQISKILLIGILISCDMVLSPDI